MERLKIQDLEVGKVYKFYFNCWKDKVVELKTRYSINQNRELIPVQVDDVESLEYLLDYNEVITGYFVEIKREIDWSKVPRGTKVQVKDKEEREWENSYFIKYESSKGEYPFQANEWQDDDYTGFKMEQYSDFYKYCRIHESVEIPEEWYKEVE